MPSPKTLMVKSFRDLMHGQTKVEILNANRVVVRVLTRINPAQVLMDAMGEQIAVPIDEPLRFDAWVFDRGSLLFAVPESIIPEGVAKICTQHDILRHMDGMTFTIDHPAAYPDLR